VTLVSTASPSYNVCMDVAERLWLRVVPMPNGCLEWTGAKSKAGYGLIRHSGHNGKLVLVHRLAWAIANGPIPKGQFIRHLVCDNPPCVNVEHLKPGTQTDNMRDMSAHGRASGMWKTHCPSGHEYNEKNTYVKPGTVHRMCRVCNNKSSLARYHRNRLLRGETK